jgi:hypothetical protein
MHNLNLLVLFMRALCECVSSYSLQSPPQRPRPCPPQHPRLLSPVAPVPMTLPALIACAVAPMASAALEKLPVVLVARRSLGSARSARISDAGATQKTPSALEVGAAVTMGGVAVGITHILNTAARAARWNLAGAIQMNRQFIVIFACTANTVCNPLLRQGL